MKRKKEKKNNSDRWLLTYSDLITLLMILFVILYALSNVDQSKYDALSKSLNKALLNSGESVLNGNKGIPDGGDGILNGQKDQSMQQNQTEQQTGTSRSGSSSSSEITNEQQLTQVENSITDIANNSNLKNSIYFSMDGRGLEISFADDVFFDSGKADIKDNMKTILDKIAVVLNQFDNTIAIEGHTDNQPIIKGDFASNWQLSSMRASNVVQYLSETDHLTPERLYSVGYGQYRPEATNDTPEGRARNRRVNMVILYKDNTLAQ